MKDKEIQFSLPSAKNMKPRSAGWLFRAGSWLDVYQEKKNMLAWHMQRLGCVCTSGSVASVCLQCTQRNVHKIGKKNCVAGKVGPA